MKISKENIKKLILTLTEIHDSLSDGEYFDIKNELNDSIKEEFVLPEKWSLRAGNIENAEIIYPYLNKKFKQGWDVTKISHHKFYLNFNETLNEPFPSSQSKQDYQEISPEDYIKHIINKDDEYQRRKNS